LKEITSRGDSVGSSEANLRAKVPVSNYNSTDKERLEKEKAEALHEKARLIQQVEQMKKELVVSQLASQASVGKPVEFAGVVVPPEEATFQPPVSISMSVGSACGTQSSGQQMPTTIQPGQKSLDIEVQEFLSQARSASGGTESEDPPGKILTPLQDQPQASTSTPVPIPSGPSTGGVSCTPADPSPSAHIVNLKRSREAAPDSDSQSITEDRVEFSGYQKKARGIGQDSI